MKKRIILGIVFIFLFSILFSSSVFAILTYDAGPSLNENLTWGQNFTNSSLNSLAFGDIDGDLDLDLALIGSSSGGKISRIYENNGTNFRENLTWQQNLTTMSQGSLAFGDIDNDGDLDLASTGCSNGGGISCTTRTIKFYENNGTAFRENETWSQNLTAVYESALAFGDIDNDGDLDLVLSGSSSGGKISKIYLNNGTALVENIQWYNNLSNLYESGLALGDIDNDGDLDLVLAGDQVPTLPYLINKIYLNNGTSLIENSLWEQDLIGVSEGSFSFIDYDNDGDLDLAHTGTGASGDITRIYENNGTSFDENQTNYATIGGVYDGSIMFGDYDNDGDLDFAINGNEGLSRIYNNNQSIFFKADPNRINIKNLLSGSSIIWIDYDNDTDLDLIEIGSDTFNNHVLVYSNNITNNPNEQPTPPSQFTNYTDKDGNIHLGWSNGSDNETPSTGLYYNIRLGSSSGSNDIISGVYGGGEDNGYFGNMMQRKNITLKSDRLSANTKYFWSVQVIDTGLQKSAWSTEQSFNISGDITLPNITLNTPINDFNSTSYTITFNISAFDNSNITNVTLYGNWTGIWEINRTNSSGFNGTDYIFPLDLTKHGNGFYLWEAETCDNSSLCKSSNNQTFLIDTTYPEISISSPANNTQHNTNDFTFTYTVSDLSIVNCSLLINNKINATDTTIAIDVQQILSTTLPNGIYNWSINCTDSVNQMNISEIYSITSLPAAMQNTGSISTGSGIRAETKEPKAEQKEIKQEPKPSPAPSQEQSKQSQKQAPKSNKIASAVQSIKNKIKSSIETIFAFIISLFIILSYTWIIKEDFKR